jgi:Protein of unknown function (DUF2867)/Pyridoxamine 5'-phosphate oxidase
MLATKIQDPSLTETTRVRKQEHLRHHWTAIRTLVDKASCCAIASISRDGSPHITPIGSVVLDEEALTGFYIEGYTSRLPTNLNHDPRICIYAEQGSMLSMLWSLLTGRAGKPMGVRLYARAGERRPVTKEELDRALHQLRIARWTRGYKRLFGKLSHVRELTFERFEPIIAGELTRGQWSHRAPDHPALAKVMVGADHVDEKVAQGGASLREFLAALVRFPWWVRALFQVRGVLARLLRLRTGGGALDARRIPGELPLFPGGRLSGFTTLAFEEGRFWFAEVDQDRHLQAWIAVTVTEGADATQRRFCVRTVVKYKDWTGPIYFNLIRPVHHLLVWILARSAAKGARRRVTLTAAERR